MKYEKAIANAKRERNLFVLELVAAGAAMAARSLKPRTAVAIGGRGRPTHLDSRNKRIRVWHRRSAYAGNAQVVRASKLTDGIDLNTSNSEYDPAEILIDSDDSDASDSNSDSKTPTANDPKASILRR